MTVGSAVMAGIIYALTEVFALSGTGHWEGLGAGGKGDSRG